MNCRTKLFEIASNRVSQVSYIRSSSMMHFHETMSPTNSSGARIEKGKFDARPSTDSTPKTISRDDSYTPNWNNNRDCDQTTKGVISANSKLIMRREVSWTRLERKNSYYSYWLYCFEGVRGLCNSINIQHVLLIEIYG